ncbi:MAG: prolyl oligopeptidase family protein [Muribaculaceae bacterium]
MCKHLTCILALTFAMNINAQKLSYPQAPKADVIDEYFGIKVSDPYRTLENDTCETTAKWVEDENAVTQAYLSAIPFRQCVKARLTELTDYEKIGIPFRCDDGRFYYYHNDGLKNQSVLYRKATLDGESEVFIDPNTLSDDGTVALGSVIMSHDGKYTAYTINRSGSDWQEIYVMNTDTRELLTDHIVRAKFSGATWYGDGFFYSAYDINTSGKEYSEINLNHRVYYHKLGTPQSEDKVYYQDAEHPYRFNSIGIDDNEKVLFLYGAGEGSGNSLKVKRLDIEGADWVTIEDSQDYEVSPIDVIDDKLYYSTTNGAQRGRIMVCSLDDMTKSEVFIPEQKGVLEGISHTPDRIILTYGEDASTHAYLYDYQGNRLSEIKLPTMGSAYFVSQRKFPEVFYSFSSFNYPASAFQFDTKTGESKLYLTPTIKGFNPDDYVTEQVFYTSADGTKVPMSLTYKKGLKRDGSNPVYLYGYGGFSISLNPGFSSYRVLWLENGGIYAQANLRGGFEYGEDWHQQGTKMNKLNVFNDFIAAAEYLIAEGWSCKERIAIEGGSNGGLLVGAVTNMRPDLFAVAIPRVGVMDMLRYHLFTIGWNWAPDYGTVADSEEMARYLIGYSPAHNIKNDGTPYPAIMVTTADHDDRVVPAHSFKYAAALQAANTGDKPKIIRIDTKAGHGAGKPVAKVIDEYADIYSFIFYNMGITPNCNK